MRKLLYLFLMLLPLVGSAQYKKTKDFFVRNGKFYGFRTGVNLHQKSIIGPALSVAFTAGRDRGYKRIWHWWDIEYVSGSRFSYGTTGYDYSSGRSDVPVTVTGRVGGYLTLRYSFNISLNTRPLAENKIVPFISIAPEAFMTNREVREERSADPDITPERKMAVTISNYGIGFGAGVKIKLNETISFTGLAGYRFMVRDAYRDFYATTPDGATISAGLLFSGKRKKD